MLGAQINIGITAGSDKGAVAVKCANCGEIVWPSTETTGFESNRFWSRLMRSLAEAALNEAYSGRDEG